MKGFLLSYARTIWSVRFLRENVCCLSKPMDLAGDNGPFNGDLDGKNDFDDSSNYNEGEVGDAKQGFNVNSCPSQWPLSQNNNSESLGNYNSYSYNGIRSAKEPRYTCTGRISRIPSRYLDTDSDSGDGSIREKYGPSKLKIKRSRRKRKLASTSSKLLVNGFGEHDDAVFYTVSDVKADRVPKKFRRSETKCLADVEYPDVFQETSPVPNDKLSHVAHKTLEKKSLLHGNVLTGSKSSGMENNKSVLKSAKDYVGICSKAKQASTTDCAADISSKKRGRPPFQSAVERTAEFSNKNETECEFDQQKVIEKFSNTDVTVPCTESNLHEARMCDSSTKHTLVSEAQISNEGQVSCAINNDDPALCSVEEKYTNCESCSGKSSFVGACPSSEICQNNAGSDLNSPCLLKTSVGRKPTKRKGLHVTKKTPKRKDLAKNTPEKLKACVEKELSETAEGLDCSKKFNVRRTYAKKMKQKMLRNKKSVGNASFKSNIAGRDMRKQKQTSVDKSRKGKRDKQMDKVKKRKVDKVVKIKDADNAKLSQRAEGLDRVLGMRKNSCGDYEFLVEWRNGTSCWVPSHDIVADKHNHYLRQYLVENKQDVSVVNRVPFQAYCCDSLSLKECKHGLKSKKALKKILCVEDKIVPRKVAVKLVKENVSIEERNNSCIITLKQETCKCKKTCLKILQDLIMALEDAETKQCEVVIVRGLGGSIFCGLTLEDMSKTDLEDEENCLLSQARYLVQTLANFRKLLIALISRPAKGIGAVLLTLFDMICDECMWNQKHVLSSTAEQSPKKEKTYSLPRLTGYMFPCEELLMGRNSEAAKNLFTFTSVSSDDDGLSGSLVARTLQEVESVLRVAGKETSLLHVGELTRMTGPNFDLFSDVMVGDTCETGSHCWGIDTDGDYIFKKDQVVDYEASHSDMPQNVSDMILVHSESIDHSCNQTKHSSVYHRSSDESTEVNSVTSVAIDHSQENIYQGTSSLTSDNHGITHHAALKQTTFESSVIDVSLINSTIMKQSPGDDSNAVKNGPDETAVDHAGQSITHNGAINHYTKLRAFAHQNAENHELGQNGKNVAAVDKITTNPASKGQPISCQTSKDPSSVFDDVITVTSVIHSNSVGMDNHVNACDTDDCSLMNKGSTDHMEVNGTKRSDGDLALAHIDHKNTNHSFTCLPGRERCTKMVGEESGYRPDQAMVRFSSTDTQYIGTDVLDLSMIVDTVNDNTTPICGSPLKKGTNIWTKSTKQTNTSKHGITPRRFVCDHSTTATDCETDVSEKQDTRTKCSLCMELVRDEAPELESNHCADCKHSSNGEITGKEKTEDIAELFSTSSGENNVLSREGSLNVTDPLLEDVSSVKAGDVSNVVSMLESCKPSEGLPLAASLLNNPCKKIGSVSVNATSEDFGESTACCPYTSNESIIDNEVFASTSSSIAAGDRYLKTLEEQIAEEKRLAEQYIEQISRLWDNSFLSIAR